MSFILDALKKADAERRLGETPGICSPAPAILAHPVPARWRRRTLPAALLLSLILSATAAVLLVWQSMRDSSRPEAEPALMPPSAAVATLPPAPAATESAPLRSAPVNAEAVAPASPAPIPIAPVANELPVPPPLPKTPAKPAPATKPAIERKSSVASTPPAPSDAAVGKTAAAADQPRLMLMSELPQSVQRELPSLEVTGSMYSADPANRMLLLNKRLMHEGEEIAPGLVLETLLPKAATLRYKQYRFQIRY